MKAHTVTVLIGCVAAVAVVVATDKLFKPIPAPIKWACITDMECQREEEARNRGERCIRVSDELFCYNPKTTVSFTVRRKNGLHSIDQNGN